LGQQQGINGSIQSLEKALENADNLLPGRSFTQLSLWLHMPNTLLAPNILQLHRACVCVQVCYVHTLLYANFVLQSVMLQVLTDFFCLAFLNSSPQRP